MLTIEVETGTTLIKKGKIVCMTRRVFTSFVSVSQLKLETQIHTHEHTHTHTHTHTHARTYP